MNIIKILTFLWPFVKELILGDKTVLQAFKTNKKKVMLAGLVMLSFGINIFVIPKLLTISSSHVILQREHDALVAKHAKDKTTPNPSASATATVVPKPSQANFVPPLPVVNEQPHKPLQADRITNLRHTLDSMRKLEEEETGI